MNIPKSNNVNYDYSFQNLKMVLYENGHSWKNPLCLRLENKFSILMGIKSSTFLYKINDTNFVNSMDM